VKQYKIPIVFSIIFFIVGIATLPDYGINWDTPYRFLRGQAFVHYLTTGAIHYTEVEQRTPPLFFKPGEYITRINALSGEGPQKAVLATRPLLRQEYEQSGELARRISFFTHTDWDANYFLTNEEPGHLPLPDILAAFSNRIVWGKLGLMGDVGSSQLMWVILSSIGVFLVSIFAYQLTNSSFAAIVAGLALAFYPLFFAESHFNLKDPVQAGFYAGVLWAFWNWIRSNKIRWFVLFGVFLAVSLGVKWNVVFLPFIVLPWLFTARKTEQFTVWFKWKKLVLLFGILAFGLVLFMIAIWPAAWHDPVKRMSYLPLFYIATGTGFDHIQPSGFILPFEINIYPVLLFLTQTPEIILALGVVGLWSLFRMRKTSLRADSLFILWFFVPLIRTMIPGIRNYGGLRQVMEIVPAIAICAGVGADFIIKKIKYLHTTIVPVAAAFVLGIILVIPVIRLHPNQNLYFNLFVGGIPGAAKHNMIDLLMSYGNIYKQAEDWLNINAEKDANLAIIEGPSMSINPLTLRSDISMSSDHFSGLSHKGEYIAVLRNHKIQPNFGRRYPEIFLTPVYQIRVDGVVFLSMYKNSPEYVKKEFQRESSTSDFQVHTVRLGTGSFIDIDLGSNIRVTRITLKNFSPLCVKANNFIYVDETVLFIPEDVNHQLQHTVLEDHLYSLQERKFIGNDTIEFYFPGESAKIIRIAPKSQYSCFNGGSIESIHYLSE
jgi:hypothetical protein